MPPIPLTQGGPADGGNYEYHWTGSFLEAHLLSDVGKKRKHNEDSCVLCVPEDAVLAEEGGLLFAVADGMGGAAAGEFASRRALELLLEEYYNAPAGSVPASLREALEFANLRIFQEAQSKPEFHGMGTTVSAVLVRGDCAYIGQVGDSRVYVVRDQAGMVQITDDHSLVAEQMRHGYLTEEEARNHSIKNLITRAIGIKETVNVDLFAFRLEQGDTILICSDGLSNLVTDEQIRHTLSNENIQAAARLLVGRALNQGGTDNVTAVLLRVTEPPVKREFDPGAEEVRIPTQGIFGKLRNLLS